MGFIILIFFCFRIAILAKQKKASKVRWVITTVFYWIVGGTVASTLLIFALDIDIVIEKDYLKNMDNMLAAMMEHSLYFQFGDVLGGSLGYLFARKQLEGLPDSQENIE